MYVPDLKSRIEGLEFLDVLGKGKHLEAGKCHLEKVAALIINPTSPGAAASPTPHAGLLFAGQMGRWRTC